MIIRYLKRLWGGVRHHFMSPIEYAKHIGVTIGENCFIPDKETWSTEPYLIKIGNNCQITMGVRIFTHGGGQVLRDEIPDYDCFGKVTIGNYVYIGNNSLIMPGVTIGNHVLVAAGSVVTKSVGDNMVVAGNPARMICSMQDYKNRNVKYNAHTKGLPANKKKQILLTMDEGLFMAKPPL